MVGGLKQNDIILEIDGNKEFIMEVSKYITSTDEAIDLKLNDLMTIIIKIKPETVLGRTQSSIKSIKE